MNFKKLVVVVLFLIFPLLAFADALVINVMAQQVMYGKFNTIINY
jgi:hypothetical protein